MKGRTVFSFLVVLSCLFFAVGCDGDSPAPSNPEQTKGSISGIVEYSSSSGNGGILITVEGFGSDGLSKGVCVQTSTSSDGRYSIGDLDAGEYTVYASSQNSREKAVTTNVKVIAGQDVTASILRLSPVGTIIGSIMVDGKTSDLTGYTIFVPSTSYIALTGSDGSFSLSDVPEGSYPLFVMKNGKSGLFYTATVKGGETSNVGAIPIYSMVFGFDESGSFIWKGSLYGHPESPSENWAYYNLSDGKTYIYVNGRWTLMSDSSGVKITWKGSLPTEPTQAQLYDAYFNTSDGCSYIFTGTEWTLIASKGSKGDKGDQGLPGLDGMPIVWKGSSPTPLEEPQELWAYYNTTDGCSYIYSNGEWSLLASSGASLNWLGGFDHAPEDPRFYDMYFNTSDGCSYIFTGTEWTLIASKGSKGDKGDQGLPGLDGMPIVWKGSSPTPLEEPQELWAYYNTTDGCSYIYSNGELSLLASSGASLNWLGGFDHAPENPRFYDMYFNTSDGCSYLYDGTEWVLFASKGGKGDRGEQGLQGLSGTSIVWKGSFATPIENPEELWAYYNTSDGCSYIYDGEKWVLLASSGASIVWLGSFPQAPENPSLYNAYYNTRTGCSYIYDGEKWTLLASKGDSGQDGQTGATGETGATGADGKSIIWKGSYMSFSDIEDPQELWAFYNTSDGRSYIYDGHSWQVLASSTSVDRERTMIIGYVKLESQGYASGVYVTATLVDVDSETVVIYKTYTNRDGYFAFSNLEEGSYLLSITADGYVSKTPDTVRVQSGTTSNIGEIELELEKGTLLGYVTLNGADDYSGVEVSVIGSDYTCQTGVDGLFEIRMVPGSYSGGIRFRKKNYGTQTYTNGFVVRKDEIYKISTKDSPIEMKATHADVVYGVVKVKGEDDNTGIRVVLDGAEKYSTTTKDSTGYWEIEDVRLGIYTLTVSSDGCSDFVRDVEISDSPREVNLKQFNLEKVVVGEPSFSIPGGTYDNDVTLSISSESGADVFYTLDGSEPTTSSSKYSSPLAISKKTIVKAIAAKGSQLSPVVEETFIMKVGHVSASVSGGIYDEAKSVELSTPTVGATIYYTMDGSTPTKSSYRYSQAIRLTDDTTLKAVALKDGYEASSALELKYTFNKPEAPTFSIGSGTYGEGSGVSLLSSDVLPGVEIHYTTDGRDPVSYGTVYTSQIALERNMTIKAFVTRGGLSSRIATSEYRVKVNVPKASVSSGTYMTKQTVALSSDSPNARIYYTTNGSTPSTSSSLYSGPLTIESNTTLKAIAVKEGLVGSETVTYSYIIDNQNAGVSVTDPVLRTLKMKLPDGWTSNMTISKGSGEYLYAQLSPNTNEAIYGWYIDDGLVSGETYLCLGSWQDKLGVGSHIIRLEAKVGGYVYTENLLLKVSD